MPFDTASMQRSRRKMVYANDFLRKTDSDTLEAAIANRGEDGIVVITPRRAEVDAERTYWLLDRAILLPSNVTVVLQNCKLKLSDRCRDNFFRSARQGPKGVNDPELNRMAWNIISSLMKAFAYLKRENPNITYEQAMARINRYGV